MSDPYTRLYAGLFFPLQERLKGQGSATARRALEHSQWLDPEALAALQLQRLRALLDHAGEHVPYYVRRFAASGFDPARVTSPADLQRLPRLTKADIRAASASLRSARAGRLAMSSTGGSSGEPLNFWLGHDRIAHDVAAKWRAMRWWGVDMGDPEIVLWGSPIELGAQDRLRALRDRLQRSRLLPAFALSPARVQAFIGAIRQRRPRMLFGYPSALDHVAATAEAGGRVLDDLDIRVAFVTGESLYPEQRARIGRVFGCPVANGYGGRDAGFIAHECPEGGLHMTAEDIVVELLAPDGSPVADGEAGEVVVTHLASRDYPFIRYRTGDIARRATAPCPCGRGLPLLAAVEGRSTDFVVARDGTVMHGLALIYVLRELPDIRAFRIVQETRASIRVAVVPVGELAPATAAAIRSGMRARLGDVAVTVDAVAAIPPEASGKYRHVVSRLAEAHAHAPAA